MLPIIFILLIAFSFAAPDPQNIESLAFTPRNEPKVVSLVFEDMDIKDLAKTLAKEGNLNIIVAPDVQGKVSGRFQDQPADKVLENILKSLNLNYVLDGNIYRIKGDTNKNSLFKEYKLSYADMDTVTKEILRFSPGLKDKLLINKGTNSLLIRKSQPELPLVDDIIKKLDAQPLQVMVEARIFEVNAEDSKRFGSKLLSGDGDSGIQKSGLETFNLSPADKTIYIRSINKDMEAYITALESRSDFNMLSTPKVIAINNREATLQTVQEVAYLDETITVFNGGQSTAKKIIFKDVGTTLKFIPHINEKDQITIDLYPEISTSVKDQTTGYPLSQTTKVHTQAVVHNGETFLIGGLLRDSEETIKSKVPLLGDIPLIGNFFRRSETVITKKEIIIMLTPSIMRNPSLQ